MNCENCGKGIRPPNEEPQGQGDFRPRGHSVVVGQCFPCGEVTIDRKLLDRIATALEKILPHVMFHPPQEKP